MRFFGMLTAPGVGSADGSTSYFQGGGGGDGGNENLLLPRTRLLYEP